MAKKSPVSPYDDDTDVGRRDFFGQLFRELAKPVQEFRSAVRGESPGVPPTSTDDAAPVGTWLRPPGAKNEWLFTATCEHSGKCIDACPARAIRRHPDGTPYIDASEQPCVVCNDLACMSACPSGALSVVPLTALGMGIARIQEPKCLRSEDVDCQLCIEACPLLDFGYRVLDLSASGKVLVDEATCVGCGCCERVCPTDPRAITITPTRVLTP